MRDGIFLYSSCGSPNYAAPELISDNQKFFNGAPIDIWSCGVILYTLLTGTLPFNEQESYKLYQQIRECKYILPNDLSDPAKDLIVRMLQKDPMNRISIPEIKQHKWFCQELNLYQVIENYKYIYGNKYNIDTDIINEMKANPNINFEGLNDEQIKDSIVTRERKEFCIVYEFLENQKNKKMMTEKTNTLKSKYNLLY